MAAVKVYVLDERSPANDPNPGRDETHKRDVEKALQRYRVHDRQFGEWRNGDEHSDKEQAEDDKIDHGPRVSGLGRLDDGFRVWKRAEHYGISMEAFNAAAIKGIMIS